MSEETRFALHALVLVAPADYVPTDDGLQLLSMGAAMADPAHVIIAQQGKQTFEQWKAERGGQVTLDLSGATISNLDLPGVDLRGANLSGTVVESLNLAGAALDGANLAGLRVTGSTNANFEHVCMGGADLTGAVIRGGRFDGADLTGAKCSDADLRQAFFRKAKLLRVRLDRASLTGSAFDEAELFEAVLDGAKIASCDFREAKMKKASLEGCVGAPDDQAPEGRAGPRFLHTDLVEANLTRADLRGAHFERATLLGAVLDGADLRQAELIDHSNFSLASFRGAYLGQARIPDANFTGADLSGTDCRLAIFHRTILASADLSFASLDRAQLNNVELENADVAWADFKEAQLNDSAWRGVRNLDRAKNVASTRIEDGHEPHYADETIIGWFNSWMSWEKIRTVGRLPLFGASYFVLLLIPAYLYFLAAYNAQVDRVRAPLEVARAKADETNRPELDRPVAVALGHLDHLPMPSWPLLTLFSSLLLAIASTVYAVQCPARIKEFTLDAWHDQLRRPVIHYLPISWSRPASRAVCGACYAVGGTTAIIIIIRKVWNAGAYIVEHTLLAAPG